MYDYETKHRLAELPLRAIVAFAARCARRVQPLVHALPRESRAAVEGAIAIAEAVAQGDTARDGTAWAARDAAWAALDAGDVALKNARDVWSAAVAASAAADAARQAVEHAERDPEGDPHTARRAAEGATAAAGSAADAARVAARDVTGGADAAVDAARNDLDRLAALQLGQPGTLGAPIDPTEAGPLGPLWPQGAPDWLPKGDAVSGAAPPDSPPEHLVLEAEVSQFADTDEVAEALAKLGYALNAYHIARGGNGLVIDDWQIYRLYWR